MFSVLHGHLLLQILELLVNLSTKNWKVPNHQSTQQHHQEPVKQAVERRRSQHSAPLAERGRDATNLPAEVEELLVGNRLLSSLLARALAGPVTVRRANRRGF